MINDALKTLIGFDALVALLHNALVDEPPLLSRDGGFVAAGYDAELDETRQLRDEGRGIIAKMQQEYIELTEISSLKIKHNNVLGYFIETTATHADKMMAPPLNETFIHRQTTANQVRFTTVPLSEIEKIASDTEKYPGLIVVDEAYIDFSDLPSMASKVGEYPNLVVLQTFSKSWGLAKALFTGSCKIIETSSSHAVS